MTSDPDALERPGAKHGGQAYVLFLISSILVLTLGLAAQTFNFVWGLGFTEIFLILLPAVIFVRLKGLPVADALRWKPVSVGMLVLSAAVGCCGWGAAVLIHRGVSVLLGDEPGADAFAGSGAVEFFGMLLAGAVLAGICEEALFRGAMQGVLERRGPTFAVVVVGILFGIYHVSPWTVPSAAFLGVLYGTLAVRTGSTVPSMLAHTCNNALAISVGTLWPESSDQAMLALAGVLTAGLGVCLFAFLRTTSLSPGHASPLIAMPADLSARMRVFLLSAVAIPVGIVLFAVVTSFRFVPMPSDALAPSVSMGEIAVIALDNSYERSVSAGDIVLLADAANHPNKGLAQVVRVEGDQVIIGDGQTEQPVPRREVRGKMVHVLGRTQDDA